MQPSKENKMDFRSMLDALHVIQSTQMLQ